MNKPEHYQAVFDATGSIRSEYIEEAAGPRPIRRALLRVTVIAASIALLIAIPVLWSCWNPSTSQEYQPMFVIYVKANDYIASADNQLTEEEIQNILPHLSSSVSGITDSETGRSPWGDYEPYFEFRMVFQGKAKNYSSCRLTITDLETGEKYGMDGDQTDNLYISYVYGTTVNNFGLRGYDIAGRFDKTTYLSLTVTGADGEIVQQQNVKVEFDETLKVYSIKLFEPIIYNAQETAPFFALEITTGMSSGNPTDPFAPGGMLSSILSGTKLDILFEGHSTFDFQIWFNSSEYATIFNTYPVIEYDGKQVRGGDSHILFGCTNIEREGQKCFSSVLGWFDEPTELDVCMYQHNYNTGEDCLLQRQTLLITPIGEEYEITTLETYINENVDWTNVPPDKYRKDGNKS